MVYTYQPKGVCSMQIDIEVEDGIVKNVKFHGGCNGNGKGIASLVRGRSVDEGDCRAGGDDVRKQADLLSGPACGCTQGDSEGRVRLDLSKGKQFIWKK